MKRLCHQRFPFLACFSSDSSSRKDHALHVHQRTSEHDAIAGVGFGTLKEVRLEERIESKPPDTDSSLRFQIPGVVFPKGVTLPTGRRSTLVQHPHPWLCGATIAVPQALRYQVVHSRITVVGQSEARLTIVASYKYTYYQDEG